MSASYQRLVAALEAVTVRRGRNFLCPAHRDHEPSLSVDEAPDGTPLVYCHAGCTDEEVLAAAGTSWAEILGGTTPRLFDDEPYGVVRRSAWLALPASVARAFGVASTLGRMLCRDGTLRRAFSGREVVARVLDRRQLRVLRDTLGVGPAQVRNLVGAWGKAGLAHRCDRRTLVVLMLPSPTCPVCHAAVGTSTGTDARRREASTGTDGPRPGTSAGTDGSRHGGAPTAGVFSKGILRPPGEPRNPTGDPSHRDDLEPPARRVVVTETAACRISVRLYGGTAETHRRAVERAAAMAGKAADDDPRPAQVRVYDGRRALELLERDMRAGRWPPWGDGKATIAAIADERRRRGWAA